MKLNATFSKQKEFFFFFPYFLTILLQMVCSYLHTALFFCGGSSTSDQQINQFPLILALSSLVMQKYP